MTCLRFSLIKLKCENHTQMSVRQFGFWTCALLSGFYGIFYVFKGSSWGFCLQRKLFPSCFFLTKLQRVCSKSPSLFEREVSSPHAPIKEGLFIEPGGAKSSSRPLHCRPRLSPCLPSLSLSPSPLFLCLSPSTTRRLMVI